MDCDFPIPIPETTTIAINITEGHDFMSMPIITPAVLITILIILIVVGNSLVILAWIFHKSVRNPQNVYYVSLGIADLLTGVIVLPFAMSYLLNRQWIHGQLICKAWLVTSFSLNPITSYHLVAIAADRYRIISEGVSYLQRRTIKRSIESCVFIWVLGLWVPSGIILDWNNMASHPNNATECITTKTAFWVVHIACTTLLFPGYLLFRIYLKVFVEIRSRLRRRGTIHSPPASAVDNDSKSNEESSSVELKNRLTASSPNLEVQNVSKAQEKISLGKEKRTAKTLAIIVGAFFLCWIPWYIFIFYEMFTEDDPFTSTTILRIGNANSFINPIIYAFRHPEFKEAFKKICKTPLSRIF